MASRANHHNHWAKLIRLAWLSVAFCISFTGYASEIDATAIYGADHRLDLYQVNSSWELELADSTVALVKSSDLLPFKGASGLLEFKTVTFQQDQKLCASEKFLEQPVVAFCSGFLVAPDLVLTAGHCVLSDGGCARTRFVFGYAVKSEGKYPENVALSEVYGCAHIVKRHLSETQSDYALIKLDREVTGHRPLSLNRTGDITTGAPVMVIGNPSGLPTKVSGGAHVRRSRPRDAFFTANLDAYGGSSGSPVFNEITGQVEGILVRGDRDYVKKGSCYISYRCGADEGIGEDVTKISQIADLIP